MKIRALFTLKALALALTVFTQGASGQEPEVPKFEIGAQFSTLVLRPPSSGFGAPDASTEAGGGLRFGVNATDKLAFEVEGNLYPRRRYDGGTAIGGNSAQVQAGVKYGRRFNRFGIFAKARPGVVTFSSVSEVIGYEAFVFAGQTFFLPNFRQTRKTYFSMDVGGVFEFYPSRRILTRIDVGDTMIRYPARGNLDSFNTASPPPLPSELRHNLQVTVGVGFRF